MSVERDIPNAVTMTAVNDEVTGEIFEITGIAVSIGSIPATGTSIITLTNSAGDILFEARAPSTFTGRDIKFTRPLISNGLKFASGPVANAVVSVYLR